MALKDNWGNKVDGIDYVVAKDINDIAGAVIDIECKESVNAPIYTGSGANSIKFNSPSNEANGKNSIAMGYGTQALHDYSIAFGSGAVADASFAIAGGTNNTSVTGEGAIGIGNALQVNGNGSLGGGQRSKTEGFCSVTWGRDTESIGAFSISTGDMSKAEGRMAVAIGDHVESKQPNQVVLGKFNKESKGAFIVGGGASVNSRGNIFYATGESIGDGIQLDTQGVVEPINQDTKETQTIVLNPLYSYDKLIIKAHTDAYTYGNYYGTSHEINMGDKSGVFINSGFRNNECYRVDNQWRSPKIELKDDAIDGGQPRTTQIALYGGSEPCLSINGTRYTEGYFEEQNKRLFKIESELGIGENFVTISNNRTNHIKVPVGAKRYARVLKMGGVNTTFNETAEYADPATYAYQLKINGEVVLDCRDVFARQSVSGDLDFLYNSNGKWIYHDGVYLTWDGEAGKEDENDTTIETMGNYQYMYKRNTPIETDVTDKVAGGAIIDVGGATEIKVVSYSYDTGVYTPVETNGYVEIMFEM